MWQETGCADNSVCFLSEISHDRTETLGQRGKTSLDQSHPVSGTDLIISKESCNGGMCDSYIQYSCVHTVRVTELQFSLSALTIIVW